MIKPGGRVLTFAIVISIWAVLSSLAIVLRIWARYSIRAFGLDDWFMIVGYVISMAVSICDFLSISYGIGTHADRISDHEAKEAKKWFLFSGIGYAIATAPIKASICVLLIRLTSGTGERIYKWILNGVILLACIGTITRVTAYTTRCKPFAAAWELVNNGHCSSAAILTNVTWFFGAVCIFTDWICAILPIFIIWHLSLPLRTKIQVGLILALGMLASIATIIRTKHVIDYQKTQDFLFGLADVGLWSETETFFGIVAGSLATMRPLLRCLSTFHLPSDQSPIGRTHGTVSEHLRGIPLHSRAGSHKHEKSLMIEYMGHSVQIIPGMARDVDRRGADGGESGSQRHILRLTDTGIVKETQYEVRSGKSDE